MTEETKLKLILYFIVGYLIVFGFLAILNKNPEFLYYIIIMTLLVIIAVRYHRKLHLPASVLTGFSIFGLLHVAGGNLFINSKRLYDLWLIKGVLKYDNLVHFIALFFITIASYSLLRPHLDKKIKHNKFLLLLLFILISLGIGVFQEILEFGAVIFFNAAERVGNYVNNALDLVFNLIGAVVASVFLLIYHKKYEEKGI